MATKDTVLAFFTESKNEMKAKDIKGKFPELTRGQIAGALWQLEKTGKIIKKARGVFGVVCNGAGTNAE